MAEPPTTPPSKRIPPLAWIIGALVVIVLAWTATHVHGSYRPPSGGPTVAEAQSGGGHPLPPDAATAPANTPTPAAPNGAGPNNEPGVQTGPAPNNAPS
jgi:hypothetical protein